MKENKERKENLESTQEIPLADLDKESPGFQEALNQVDSEEKNRKMYLQFFVKLLLFAITLFVLFGVIFNVRINHDNYMYPSIKDGDLVMTYKLDKNYNNDDVVLYKTADNELQFGRIVAQENDEIDISDDGVIKINKQIPSEEVFYKTAPAKDSSIKYPYKVPSASVFILNDFRDDTTDSREYKAIYKTAIVGKVVFTIRRRGF